jgi:hypothetical protein
VKKPVTLKLSVVQLVSSPCYSLPGLVEVELSLILVITKTLVVPTSLSSTALLFPIVTTVSSSPRQFKVMN